MLIRLDTYHMNIEEDDLVRPVREVFDRLGHGHIGETHRGQSDGEDLARHARAAMAGQLAAAHAR